MSLKISFFSFVNYYFNIRSFNIKYVQIFNTTVRTTKFSSIQQSTRCRLQVVDISIFTQERRRYVTIYLNHYQRSHMKLHFKEYFSSPVNIEFLIHYYAVRNYSAKIWSLRIIVLKNNCYHYYFKNIVTIVQFLIIKHA